MNMALDYILKQMRDEAEARIKSLAEALEVRAKEIGDDYQRRFDLTLKMHRKRRCEKCNGTGAVERLDAGFMRRFDLRDWNGCTACGSTNREERGCGYIDAEALAS